MTSGTEGPKSRAHITALVAENVKRLRVVRLEPGPGGGLIEVSGANGSGKSSLLDAIGWALLGQRAIDPKPIRDGEEKASVTLTLGDVTITRRWNANGGSTLTVESAEGARFPSPQKMLDELVGKSVLTFDPLEFDRMKPADQLEEVRKVAPLPREVDDYRRGIDESYERRTEKNRRAKELAGKLAGAPTQAPARVHDVAAITDRLENVGRLNAARAAERRRRADEALSIRHDGHEVDRLIEEAEAMQRKAAELQASREARSAALEALPPVADDEDAAAIRADLEAARAEERAALEWETVERDRRQLAALEEESRAFTSVIETLEAKVREAVAAATMPVPGLRYGDKGLEFNGHPLEQASGAERLRVALGLAMAQRPGLRVVRIKDGSLLDARSLAMVADMAAAQDFQVWIERVDTTGRVGVVLEEGEVVKVNPRGTDGEG